MSTEVTSVYFGWDFPEGYLKPPGARACVYMTLKVKFEGQSHSKSYVRNGRVCIASRGRSRIISRIRSRSFSSHVGRHESIGHQIEFKVKVKLCRLRF